jgi:hypothetical protein
VEIRHAGVSALLHNTPLGRTLTTLIHSAPKPLTQLSNPLMSVPPEAGPSQPVTAPPSQSHLAFASTSTGPGPATTPTVQAVAVPASGLLTPAGERAPGGSSAATSRHMSGLGRGSDADFGPGAQPGGGPVVPGSPQSQSVAGSVPAD